MSKQPPETIILVDDNRIDNKLHSRLIKRSGLAKNILCFETGEQVLEYLRSPGALPVDLMFLDINMPRMTGFEFLEAAGGEFGNAFAPSVIVMLTTSMDPLDRERAENFPVIRDYIMKPLNGDEFHRVLDQICAKPGDTPAA